MNFHEDSLKKNQEILINKSKHLKHKQEIQSEIHKSSTKQIKTLIFFSGAPVFCQFMHKINKKALKIV